MWKSFKSDILKSLIIALIIGIGSYLPIIDLLNLTAYNQKFIFRGQLKPDNKVVIVSVDDESIDWMSKWPWPRSYHAKIVDILKEHGAALILFDVFFDSPTQFDPQDDVQFAESVKKAQNVILAANFQNIKENAFFKVKVEPFKRPIKMLDDAALDLGVVHPYFDKDNVVRRFQIIYHSGDKEYYSLALQAVRYIQNKAGILLIPGNRIKCGRNIIPLQGKNLLVNYYGPSRTFETVPYVRIYDGSFLKDSPDFFKGKIVLIGASTEVLHDVFPTPFDINMPGVEIHANVIQTILDGLYISKISFIYLLGLLILFVYINVIISHMFKIRFLFLLVVVQTAIIFIGNAYIFKYFRLEIPTYTLISSIFITFVVQTVIKFISEEKEKRKIRGVFSQYVAPSVVDELLAHPDKVELGGSLREVTIFFSDIRSFTTFSESHTPAQVVEQLNEYLDEMTKVIFEFGGTLDKYVGDEIMAIFGAPLPLANHPKIAMDCCIAQLKKLRALQQKWKEQGKTVLDIGMGLNTGEVIVGNIGSDMHKDYTVIGDAVNLAARLESATRNYTTPEHTCYLLISEFTYEKVKEYYKCNLIDEIAVKGKKTKTKIYEVVIEF